MERYRTFKRSVKSFEDYGKKRKMTVDTGLTFSEAQRQCDRFNKNRNARQKRNGTMMEFERE